MIAQPGRQAAAANSPLNCVIAGGGGQINVRITCGYHEVPSAILPASQTGPGWFMDQVPSQYQQKMVALPNIPKKSRHILLRYHFIKFAVESGLIEVHYIDTKQQRADCLTKALSPSDFKTGISDLLNLSEENIYFPI